MEYIRKEEILSAIDLLRNRVDKGESVTLEQVEKAVNNIETLNSIEYTKKEYFKIFIEWFLLVVGLFTGALLMGFIARYI